MLLLWLNVECQRWKIDDEEYSNERPWGHFFLFSNEVEFGIPNSMMNGSTEPKSSHKKCQPMNNWNHTLRYCRFNTSSLLKEIEIENNRHWPFYILLHHISYMNMKQPKKTVRNYECIDNDFFCSIFHCTKFLWLVHLFMIETMKVREWGVFWYCITRGEQELHTMMITKFHVEQETWNYIHSKVLLKSSWCCHRKNF